MESILLILETYGWAIAAGFSLLIFIVMLVVNKKVKTALRRIIALKDEARLNKADVLEEAFNVISKMEKMDKQNYISIAEEADAVYNKMYSVISDAKVIQEYDKVIRSFILVDVKSVDVTAFEALCRKEMGLNPVTNKNKQNYALLIRQEEEKYSNQMQVEKQKEEEKQEKLRLQEEEKAKRLAEKETKRQEKLKAKEAITKEKEESKLEVIEEPKPAPKVMGPKVNGPVVPKAPPKPKDE